MIGEPKKSVLFVCMGNICRSPTAEGVFRKLVQERGLADRFEIDSAGTHAYHVGEPPDRRAVEAAARRGIALSTIRARQVADEDFDRFDLIVAMDEDNLERLQRLGRTGRARVTLFLEYAASTELRGVPDPYYGGGNGFEQVLDLVEEAAEGLLRELVAGK